MTITTDLLCLSLLALWSVPLAHLPAVARMRAAGTAWGLGNRDQAPEVPDWVKRADRAQRNHLDNLPLYAIAILSVAVAGRADHLSAVAALAILLARVFHSIVYIAGITTLGLRSTAYFVALFACLVVFSRLL